MSDFINGEPAGAWIHRHRKARNITQAQLAEQMAVSRQTVALWESGASYPRNERLAQLQQIFSTVISTATPGHIELGRALRVVANGLGSLLADHDTNRILLAVSRLSEPTERIQLADKVEAWVDGVLAARKQPTEPSP